MTDRELGIQFGQDIMRLREQTDAQAALIAHLMGADVELTQDVVERATGIEAARIPDLEIVIPDIKGKG